MIIEFDFLSTLIFVVVLVCWFGFAVAFLFRKQPPKAADQKRARASITGVVLQAFAYALVWSVHRRPFTPMFSGSVVLNAFLDLLAVSIAIGSVLMVLAAVNTLGKEWSVTARLVEGHKLATTGPYRLVRHPIYTGMLGMLIATGLAISHWLVMVPAILIFLIGTLIRIRSEEKLLREAFGPDFDAYTQRVSAIIPGVF